MKRAIGIGLALWFGMAAAASTAEPITVASKNFPESYILGEIVAQLLEAEGFAVDRKLGLGGTKICYDALVAGDVDVYVEYTGTITEAIKDIHNATPQEMAAALAVDGVEMLPTFGFNNTYALAASATVAERLGLAKISDLARHADLRIAVSHEFLERQDGWPQLSQAYGLPQEPHGIEHALAYQALADGAIDVMDAYSTDGELIRYPLTVLEDDQGFFPTYLAVPLARADLDARAKAAIARTANTLDEGEMRTMNAAMAEQGEAAVARSYIAANFADAAALAPSRPSDELWRRLGANTAKHLELVALAVVPAAAVAVLLALAIFKTPLLARSALYLAGLLQTIPSIALLALLIPLVGIGTVPAVIALFLYALLPILRNALTALAGIDPTLRRVAVAMGLKPLEELRHVFVPLAMPSILAGIRTAAVISIGTATLAAFIGAGGLGDPIVTGLSLNDTGLILEGAIPAALLAIVTELAFEQVERWLLPGHLRTA